MWPGDPFADGPSAKIAIANALNAPFLASHPRTAPAGRIHPVQKARRRKSASRKPKSRIDRPAITTNRARVMPPPSVCFVKKRTEDHAPEQKIREMFLRIFFRSHLTYDSRKAP